MIVRISNNLWRLRVNLFVIMAAYFVNTMMLDNTTPTLHQYVTNGRGGEVVNTNETYENYPGLGESELFYSIVNSIYCIGNVISALSVGFLLLFVPFSVIFLCVNILTSISCILYSVAYSGWLVALSRFLWGISYRGLKVATLAYIGSMESDYIKAYKADSAKKREQKAKKLKEKEAAHTNGNGVIVEQSGNKDGEEEEEEDVPIKKTALTIAAICAYFPGILAFAVSATISQIPTVNFFRGIGYFNTACSLVVLVLMVVLFRDKAKVNLKVCKERMLGCCRMGKLDLSFTKVIVLGYLTYYLTIWYLAILILLLLFSPILSDSFGLTVKETNYFFVLFISALPIGAVAMFMISKLIRPRLIAIGALIFVIVGSALMADWQTLREDPCRIFSPFDYSNSSISCVKYNKSSTVHQYCIETQVAAESGDFTEEARRLCRETEGCHWNQFSVLSHSFCLYCPAICRGTHQSFSIIQFTIGALIFALALAAVEASGWILMLNYLKEDEQGPFLGIVYAVNGMVGAVAPMAFDTLYEKFHKRTTVPMALFVVLCCIALAGMLILYRVLVPKDSATAHASDKTSEEEQMLVE